MRTATTTRDEVVGIGQRPAHARRQAEPHLLHGGDALALREVRRQRHATDEVIDLPEQLLAVPAEGGVPCGRLGLAAACAECLEEHAGIRLQGVVHRERVVGVAS